MFKKSFFIKEGSIWNKLTIAINEDREAKKIKISPSDSFLPWLLNNSMLFLQYLVYVWRY
jgi:hypothetical protein